jgi:hypothetical protein
VTNAAGVVVLNLLFGLIQLLVWTTRREIASEMSEDPGLRAQLESTITRLALIEHEADNWEDSPRPTAEFIRYLRRLGLLPSRIT